jgi:ATP-dependent DNA ligase
MDILNWLYIRKQQLIKTTPDSTDDLLVLGADATFAKRGDKYKSYAMPLVDLVPAMYDLANVTQATSITTGVTVNAHSGVITTVSSTLAANTETTFTVTNSKVTTDSKIFLQIQYANASTGVPTVHVSSISAGSFVIDLLNASTTAALNDVVKIHYMILD